jgi:hypothetical protein
VNLTVRIALFPIEVDKAGIQAIDNLEMLAAEAASLCSAEKTGSAVRRVDICRFIGQSDHLQKKWKSGQHRR